MANISIKPGTYQYPELISKIEQGMVKIPAFQRDFVWAMDKTLFLLDSIARRYPIGTFLFWQSSDFINALRNIGNLELADPPSGYPVQYVLDGQQRITSLYAALKSATIDHTPYRVCLDLDTSDRSEELFFATEPDQERYVLVSDLLGEDYGEIFVQLTPERRKRFDSVRTTFLNYPFSMTLVEGGDLDIVCDLFERINNTGVELSVFDLLVARTWSPPEDNGGFSLRTAYDELTNELAQVAFEEIPEPVIAQLSSAIIKHDCTRKAILTIDRSEMRDDWPRVVDSLKAAVDFVRKKLRVTASRILPYPSILVSLAYFYHRNGMRNPNGDQSHWLARYFYVNGFSNRLSSGTQSKLTDDLKIIDKLVAQDSAQFDVPVSVAPEDIRDTELRIGNAYCKSVLCLLASIGPKDFRDGSEVLLYNRALKRANSRHFHHLFPKAYIRGKQGAEEVNSVANISLIPMDLNLTIGKKAPSQYLTEFERKNDSWNKTLNSHAIGKGASTALVKDDFPGFLLHRSRAISRLAKRAIGEQDRL